MLGSRLRGLQSSCRHPLRLALLRLRRPRVAPASSAAACMEADAAASTPADDRLYMSLALEQARLAADAQEVPVGAVLVSGSGELLASAHNMTVSTQSPLAHAEMLCIQAATQQQQGWRLLQATLYTTLEPCPMCAGAILQSRCAPLFVGGGG